MFASSLRAEFRLRPATELADIRSATESEAVELDNAIYAGDGQWYQHLTLRSQLSAPTLRDHLSNGAVDGLVGLSPVEFDEHRYFVLVRVEEPDPFVVKSVAQTGAVPHRVELLDRQLTVTASVSDWTHLKRLAEHLETAYRTFELLRTAQAETPGFPLDNHKLKYAVRNSVATSQLELLGVAYRQGYFDVPRTVTSAQLAEHVGISQSTLSERLRSAQRALLAALFGRREPPDINAR